MASPAAMQNQMAGADRWSEEAKQRRIEDGLSQLARIFEGGAYGTGYVDPKDARVGQRYYTATGDEYVVPATLPGLPVTARAPQGALGYREWANQHPYYRNFPAWEYGSNATAAQRAAAAEYDKYLAGFAPSGAPGTVSLGDAFGDADFGYSFWKAAKDLPALYTGRAETAGFGDDFYNQKRDAYLNYATPQLEDQYGDARRQVAFALSRAGMTDSSVASNRFGDLTKDYGLRKQEVADTAQNYAQDLRAKTAEARASAATALYSGQSPDEVARQALSTANQLIASTPQQNPIGAVFQNAAAGLAGYMDGSRYNDMRSRVEQEYNIQPATGKGSGRVVGRT